MEGVGGQEAPPRLAIIYIILREKQTKCYNLEECQNIGTLQYAPL